MTTSPFSNATTTLALLCVVAGAPGVAGATDLVDAEWPVVITPPRLKQSAQDVPASVTVLTAATLERHGVTSIAEAMRLVPGMLVTRLSGGRYAISYHGTSLINARRMNLLIDGVSVYRPALSEIPWDHLPVAIDDVDRIEVTRGAGSAAYGPHSMLAVINILTRHPDDVPRASASIGHGDQGERSVHTRVAWGQGDTRGYVTASGHRDREAQRLGGAVVRAGP